MEEETGTVKMVMSKKKTVKMVKMGVMVAISVAMVYLVHFPIFPAVPFLEYDLTKHFYIIQIKKPVRIIYHKRFSF